MKMNNKIEITIETEKDGFVIKDISSSITNKLLVSIRKKEKKKT
jgi:hypothetical protein